jgi:hypothetical protein
MHMSYQTMTSVADAIHALPNPYPPVSLTKYYKGTTLSQQGRIVDINPLYATVQATKRHTFHTLWGMIHMRSGAFEGAISASIRPLDYTNGTFHLSDLSYSEWQDRKSERVQPKCPVYINMHYYRKIYRAFLEDISNEGMGILVSKTIDPNDRLRPGVKLSLEFPLTSEHILFNLKGMIIYRKNVGQQLIKCGLHLLPNVNQKTTLEVYITQRYEEILAELQQEYIHIQEQCRVEHQYF